MTMFHTQEDYENWLSVLSRYKDDIKKLKLPKKTNECKGDFDKKVVGKHCYPHWHSNKY